MSEDLVGVIPAAGQGTRMRPLTDKVPKALVSIQGRTLLERAIESLKSLGVSKIVIVTGYLGEMVRDFVAGRDFQVPIYFVAQEQQLGLAHALTLASAHINGNFVIFCPDNLYSDPDDLERAKQLFNLHRPAVLTVATVTPTRQQERGRYATGAMRLLAPHLYEDAGNDGPSSGLPLNSTGCMFLAQDSLSYLPSFEGMQEEHKFHRFVTDVTRQRRGLIYLLRGLRYDFSEPNDINIYAQLQASLSQAQGAGVSTILLNRAGKVLLQLRDDNPRIRYPNHWALFGGSVEEEDESPYAAASREVQEEINYEATNLGLFREFVQNNKREYAFVGEIGAELSDLSLTEGQDMSYFDPSELGDLLIRPDDRETLRAYFGG